MSTLERAIQIATEAHHGQVDKAGNDYILHPLRVMELGNSLEEKIVGVLHDVVEDTDWTFERLADEGFSPIILDALRCVTKLSENEPYDHFISRVQANPLAIAVGGDSDTIGAIVGAIAEAIWGVPEEIYRTALTYLPHDIRRVYDDFCKAVVMKKD